MTDVIRSLTGTQYLVKYLVGYQQDGFRLDRFLMIRYKKRSREQIKRAIEKGAITITRKDHMIVGKMKPSMTLKLGDTVNVLTRKRKEPEVNFDYRVMYEDEDLMVINKPPNLPVHPAGKYFFHSLLVHLKTKGFTVEHNSEKDFYLVHRIDRETSGILLLAKNRDACNKLTDQFRKRETEKYYLAITHGTPKEELFHIDSPIGKIDGSPIGLKMYTVPEANGGLHAQTRFEKIESREGYSLLACYPKTGRQHQIRVHADHAGLPLVGDKLYGLPEEDCLVLLDYHTDLREHEIRSDEETSSSDESAEDANENEEADSTEDTEESPIQKSEHYLRVEKALQLPRHALHAAGLKFKHPRTGNLMTFEAELPHDLKHFFESLDGRKLSEVKTKHWS